MMPSKILSYAFIPLVLLSTYTVFNHIQTKKRRRLERVVRKVKARGNVIQHPPSQEEEDTDEERDYVSLIWNGAPPIPSDEQDPFSSRLVSGRFVNPFHGWVGISLWDLVKWTITRRRYDYTLPNNPKELDKLFPIVKPDFNLLFENEKNNDLMTFTWLGQSTSFVQMGGVNVLTDPVFLHRTISNFLGPKRLRPPPCSISELPSPDLVLISHNHYDHLDKSVVQEIGNKCRWYVPLGLRDWFVRRGVTNVVEMDWWQEFYHSKHVKIVCVPTQHWSGRHLFDYNKSLWSGFLVIDTQSQKSFFHCGDTGYCPVFKTIGERYGPITLSALPIGAYSPKWFMKQQHLSPQEAVQVHLDLKSQFSVGVHYGTFLVGDENWLEPRELFKRSAKELLEREEKCFTTDLGETISFP